MRKEVEGREESGMQGNKEVDCGGSGGGGGRGVEG